MARSETLTLQHVGKTYDVDGHDLRVLDHISLSVEPGSFVSIVGPSGCGKSTLLRLLVGLDQDFDGLITLGDRPVRGTSLERGIVFQDHRLLPWQTVEDNIKLALINSGLPDAVIRERVAGLFRLVGLTGFENVFPHQLSGGMAQRAAIARGLVTEPSLLLLDEPLGALDALTRVRLQDELLRIWHDRKITTILVTHDVEEAIYLGTRVLVMQPGPGHVSADLDINLPYPRRRADPHFNALRLQVLEAMESSPVSAAA